MHKNRKHKRELFRREALKGLGATIAVAAVGCSADPNDPAAPPGNTPGSAGSTPAAPSGGTSAATAGSQPVSAAGSTATATAGTTSKPASAGTTAVAPSAGTTAPVSSSAGSGAAGASVAGAPGTTNVAGGPAAGAGGMSSANPSTDLASLQCIVTPAMTDGPFFVDEKLNRSNLIMGETSDAIVKAVPLKLVMGVFEVNGMMCKPLTGVQVDIWHADAIGVYSDVASGAVQATDTRGKKFLRGYQVTNEQGVVTFETAYPGWYMSRTIHIHFKLRMLGSGATFTSQMFFDEAINAMVMAKPAYSNRSGKRSVLNDGDHIYNGTATNAQKPPSGSTPPGKVIMPALVAVGEGYTATLKIGVKA